MDRMDIRERIETNIACSRWGSFLWMGIFLVVLGTLALTSVVTTTFASVIAFGLILIGSGIFHLVHAFWTSEWSGFFGQVAIGILSGVVGWMLIANPALGAVTLTLFLAAFFIASGLFKIAAAFLAKDQWGWILFNGIVTLALGLLIFVQWPTASLWLLGLFIAIDLVVTGWTNIMIGFSLRKECKVPTQRAA